MLVYNKNAQIIANDKKKLIFRNFYRYNGRAKKMSANRQHFIVIPSNIYLIDLPRPRPKKTTISQRKHENLLTERFVLHATEDLIFPLTGLGCDLRKTQG